MRPNNGRAFAAAAREIAAAARRSAVNTLSPLIKSARRSFSSSSSVTRCSPLAPLFLIGGRVRIR